MLRHSLGGDVIFFLCSTFFAPSLNLMPCLSSWLEIIACLHSRDTREAIRAVISRREDKPGIKFTRRSNKSELQCLNMHYNEWVRLYAPVYKSYLKTYKSCLKLIFHLYLIIIIIVIVILYFICQSWIQRYSWKILSRSFQLDSFFIILFLPHFD